MPVKFSTRLHFLVAFCLLLALPQPPSIAADPVVPDCPTISWSTPSPANEPKIFGYYFGAIDKLFSRVNPQTKVAVTTPDSIIGCYVSARVAPTYDDAKWDVGVINRDSVGFFWRNVAGRVWRLTPDFAANKFTTGSDNPYTKLGNTFELIVPFDSTRPATCKIMSQGNFSPGFSRLDYRLYGKSEAKVKIIIPEFIDDPTKINFQDTVDALNLSRVQAFYKSMSYGKVTLSFSGQDRTFKLPGKSTDYIDEKGKNELVFKLMKLAYAEFLKVNPNRDYDVIVFAMPREYVNPHAGFATDLSALSLDYWNDVKIRVTWMGSAPHSWGDPDAPPWKVLAHELGHNFGLSDLYSVLDTELMNNYLGKTIGPFDIMGSLSAKGNELSYWNRWLLGWIDDSQIACVSSLQASQSVELSPISNDDKGTKGIVIPTSLSTAILIESRKAQGYDSTFLADEVGLVVYKIDTKIGSGAGPISVVPKSNQYSGVAFSSALYDNKRFLKAPLQVGDSLVVDGIRIINVGDSTKDKALITLGADPRIPAELSIGLESSYFITRKEVVPKITTNSTAAVTLTSITTDTCTYESGKVLLLKVGTCRISATQGITGTYLPPVPQEVSFEIGIDPQVEIDRQKAMKDGAYLMAPDCHAAGMNGEVQIKDAQGNWTLLTPRGGQIAAPAGCPATHPTSMWAAINAPQNSVIRWRFWTNGWEGFSNEIIWVNQITRAKEYAASVAAQAAAKAAAIKTITCTKGSKIVKVTNTNPKCPVGYKLKK